MMKGVTGEFEIPFLDDIYEVLQWSESGYVPHLYISKERSQEHRPFQLLVQSEPENLIHWHLIEQKGFRISESIQAYYFSTRHYLVYFCIGHS